MNEIDRHIGSIIKTLRKNKGLSQMELAEKMGISFQQVQKYEKGMTRIPVFRLKQISEALGIHISFFFKGNDADLNVQSPSIPYGREEIFQTLSKEEITLLKLFRKIRNKKLKEGIIKQLKGIAEMES